ncbi:MAG: ATP-grasp domain-containing protein [Aestuariivirga sp.]
MKSSFKNILILSAGRRVELLKAFQVARDRLVPGAKVFAADAMPALSSACQIADQSFVAPRTNTSNFIDWLWELAVKFDIGLIVPTIDSELIPLAKARDRFCAAGIEVSVSDLSFVERCHDKRLSGALFQEIDCRYPNLMAWDLATFPAFAKPVSGSSSKGAILLNDVARLPEFQSGVDLYMLMEYIGPPFAEYSVDLYFDCASNLRCLVPRKRLEVRAGEISKGVTYRQGLYEKLRSRLEGWNGKGLRGCITTQMFYDEQSDEIVGLEINPRFGGGYPLSHAAGADFPDWLIREILLGEKIEFYDSWETDLLMLRYDASVMVHNAKI